MYKVCFEKFDPVQQFIEYVTALQKIGNYSSHQVNRMFLWAVHSPENRVSLPVSSKEVAERLVIAGQKMDAICTLLPISQEEYDWLWEATGGEVKDDL